MKNKLDNKSRSKINNSKIYQMINKLKIILNNHYSIYSKLFKIIIFNYFFNYLFIKLIFKIKYNLILYFS